MTSVLLVVGPATGGMGSHVASLSTGLPALGRPVTVFTSPQTAHRFALGGRVLTGWRGGPRGLLSTLTALRRLIREHDVVHAHGHQAGLLTVLAARTLRHRPPVVVSWHNAVLVGGLRRRVLAGAEAVQARGATLLTGASADLVERARALGARAPELAEVAAAPFPVTPPGARRTGSAGPTGLTRSTGSTGSKGPPGSTGPTVLTVSRIAPQKRLDVLVEAAALLAPQIPGLTWLVAGDGDSALLAVLERRSADLAAPVRFLGARSDVPALMAAADVFALTSTWEARALVVQEAMASGLPVVATAVGGLPDLLGPTGLLVPPGDAPALAAGVHRLLTEPVLAADLAAAGRTRFAGLPTAAEVVKAWSERYRALGG